MTARVGRINLRNPPNASLSFGAIRYAIEPYKNYSYLVCLVIKTPALQANIHAPCRASYFSRIALCQIAPLSVKIAHG
jgi:hypothetical protein